MDNIILLSGNLGKDPNVRYSKDGLAITNFSLAVNRQKDGEQKTIWVYIRVFGKLAEVMGNSLTKGSKISLKGRLEVDEWEIDGEKKSSTYVIANRIKFLDKKKSEKTA